MLTAYIKAALRKAHYEMLPDGEGYLGTIRSDIGRNLLRAILREAGISVAEWENL